MWDLRLPGTPRRAAASRRAALAAVLFAALPHAQAQPALQAEVVLVPPGASGEPALVDAGTLALPAALGGKVFVVSARGVGVSGTVTVAADAGGIPLPIALGICRAEPRSGDCLEVPQAQLRFALASEPAPLVAVQVAATSSLPFDALRHRVRVTFRDAAGALLGGASVAVGNANYGRQIAISRGGAYSGHWTNDHITTGEAGGGGNAVFISTTEPVVLQDCFIRTTRNAVQAVPGANVTIRNCRGYGVDPGVAGQTRGYFVFAQDIGQLTMENNDVREMAWGAALWALPPGSGRWTTQGPIAIRYNRVRNLDGLKSDGRGGRVTDANPNENPNGFVSINRLNLAHGADIAWNEVVHEPYVSAVGDIVDLWASPGTPAAPAVIRDNLFKGQYAPIPERGNGIDPSNCAPGVPTCYGTYVAGVVSLDGSAQDTAADATAYVRIHGNHLVNTWGNIIVGSGHHNEAFDNRVVSTGQLANGHWFSPSWGAGLSLYDSYRTGPAVFFANAAYRNIVGFRLEQTSPIDPSVYLAPPMRRDYAFEARAGSLACSGAEAALCYDNQSLPDPITAETEVAEVARWQGRVVAAGVTIGPRTAVDCLFDWAEKSYPAYLAPARAPTLAWLPYVFRAYPGSGAYLGVSAADRHLYYLGPASGGLLLDLGQAAAWSKDAQCG